MPSEDARAGRIVWTQVYFNYLTGILDAQLLLSTDVPVLLLNQPISQEDIVVHELVKLAKY